MKKNIIPSNNLFKQLDNLDEHKKISLLHSKDILIVSSKYHKEINDSLITDFVNTIDNNYSIGLIEVPGAFELSYIIKKVLNKFSPKLVLVVACIIKGDTKHDEYLSSSIINSINVMSMDHLIPIINGILTTNTLDQAINRAGKKYRKGKEYAETSMEMLSLLASLDDK